MKMELGQRVYYTGDMANIEDSGTITTVHPEDKWAPESYTVDLDDGRVFRKAMNLSFDSSPGRRFWPLDEWQETRRTKVLDMQKRYRVMQQKHAAAT